MGKLQTSLEKVDIMAVNNAGAQLDSAGEIAIDFVWGNFAPQPNDSRTTRLNLALGDHINLESGWNGYPQYTPNTTGSDVAGSTDYVKVTSVLGFTTADAADVLADNGLTVTTAAATTNAASTITAVARTGTTATITSTGAGAKYPVGTKIVVSSLVSPDTALNGTWTVTAVATNTVSFTTTTSGTLSTGSLSVAGLVGLAGTIKTQSIAGGAATTAPGAAVTITPWATAS
jgi:hypothetical protein